jgi:gliding motility-associated-like protein
MLSHIGIIPYYKYICICCFILLGWNSSLGKTIILESDSINLSYTIITENASCNSNDGSISILALSNDYNYVFEWVLPSGDTTITAYPTLNGINAGVYHLSIGMISNEECLSEGDISFDIIGGNPSNLTEYILTDSNGEILDISLDPSFSNIEEGDYHIYAINYTDTLSNYGIGENIENITAECFDLSNAYPFSVCEPDCYTILEPIIVGLDSDLETPETVITPATCNLSDGEIVLSPSGYIYEWSDGFIGNIRNDLSSGNYTLSYYEEENPSCISYFNVIIADNNPLEAEVLVLSTADCDENNGAASIMIEGGSGSYHIIWSDGGEGAIRNDLAIGTHVVNVEDSISGCMISISFGISSPNDEADIIVENITDISCNSELGIIAFSVIYETDFIFPADTIITDGNLTYSANNLPSGNYCLEIRDSIDCLKAVTCFEIQEFAPISSQITIVNGNCSVANMYINTIGGGGNYTYDWDDIIGTDNPKDRENIQNGNYTVSITDSLGCMEIIDIPILIPNCNDTITIDFLNGITSIDTCLLEWYDLDGEISSSNLCEDNTAVISTSINTNDTCISLSIDETVLSDGDTEMLCVYHCNDVGLCDTTYIIINVIGAEECPDFQNQIESIIVLDSCNELISICIPINVSELSGYEVLDNGISTPLLFGCNEDTIISYNYLALFGQGDLGPYILDAWYLNGNLLSGEFQDMTSLVDSMNIWDTEGNWELNENLLLIIGGAADNMYSDMNITHIMTGSPAVIGFNYGITGTGAFFNIEAGEHEIIISNSLTACSDTLNIEVSCPPFQLLDFTDTISIDEFDTICITDLGYDGEISTINTVCPESSGIEVLFEIDTGNACIIYDGVLIGEDFACIEICDALGICDTSYITIIVVEEEIDSNTLILNNDEGTTNINTAITLFPLVNDTVTGIITGITISMLPTNGLAETNPDGTITYIPNANYCGIDSLSYIVCNPEACDTANIYIFIDCQDIHPFTGFSPNADGVNDYFVIQGIEAEENINLSIFNRWGNRVYTLKNGRYGNTPGQDGFSEPWDGRWNGKQLPDGTYFYRLDLKTGARYAGYVYLRR